MGELGDFVSLKTPGKIDFINGKMGWFVCYCPNCRKKVILDRQQFNLVRYAIARPAHFSTREITKRVLLKAVDKLEK